MAAGPRQLFSCVYSSPIGNLTLCGDGSSLCGLWMEGQKYFGAGVPRLMMPVEAHDDAVLSQAAAWLDAYFGGERPNPGSLRLDPAGSAFRHMVWDALKAIPYGRVVTYGEIARQVAWAQGRVSVASLAVGGAVGHNPISVIVPCHRVVGADGSLTGYAGGLDRKLWLLEHEGVDTSCLYRPTKGTAL